MVHARLPLADTLEQTITETKGKPGRDLKIDPMLQGDFKASDDQ